MNTSNTQQSNYYSATSPVSFNNRLKTLSLAIDNKRCDRIEVYALFLIAFSWEIVWYTSQLLALVFKQNICYISIDNIIIYNTCTCIIINDYELGLDNKKQVLYIYIYMYIHVCMHACIYIYTFFCGVRRQ